MVLPKVSRRDRTSPYQLCQESFMSCHISFSGTPTMQTYVVKNIRIYSTDSQLDIDFVEVYFTLLSCQFQRRPPPPPLFTLWIAVSVELAIAQTVAGR